jgi:ferredoxin
MADTSSGRAVVDGGKCRAYGICAEICPDVFKLDDHGFAYVDGDTPVELEDAVVEACEVCPAEAITIERVDDREGESP